MAIPDITFSPADDIHLLRGMTVNLMDKLRVGSDTAADFHTAHPGVTYSFTPFFKRTSGAGNTYTGSNITVDTATGVITTQQAAPATEKHNFLVRAVATLGADTAETIIRIHIHQSIQSAWLSPPILTAHQPTTRARFSVRLRFDDDIVAEVGDLSTGSSAHNDNLYPITWAHPVAGLVDPASGRINTAAAPNTGLLPDQVEATLALPALGINQVARGQVFISDLLSGTRNDIGAELVTTGNCPGFDRAEDVPNFLFVPDGFTTEDSDVFDALVDQFVSNLTHGKISAPFDLLAGSMNFYKVFLSSGDRGATTRANLYIKEHEGDSVGVRLYRPIKPIKTDGTDEPDGSRWSYVGLYYHFGIPIPDDAAMDPADLRAEWKEVTSIAPAQIDAIGDEEIQRWVETAERRLPEERDTALGLLVNDVSAAVQDDDYNQIHFNGAKRLRRRDLDTFLLHVTDEEDNPIGRFFTSGAPGLRGKDYDNIIFVSAAANARENNFDGGFFIVVNRFPGFFAMEGDPLLNFKVAIETDNDIESLTMDQQATMTHELGHSFALEDEYGESPSSDRFRDKFINDPLVAGWPFTRFTDGPEELDWSGNVQARHDLLTPDTNNPGTARLDAMKLKWRYHRIDLCGVVAGFPAAAGANYTIPLRAGQGSQFQAGQKVFLRKRVRYRYTVEREGGGGVLAVPAQDVQTLTPATIIHPAGTVTGVNPGARQITIRDADNTVFTVTFVNAGSAARFNTADTILVARDVRNEPIASITRTPAAANPNITSDTITRLITSELEVVTPAADSVIVKVSDGTPLPDAFLQPAAGETMILYKPMDASSDARAAGMKYAEVISKRVLDYLVANPFPFNARKDSAHGDALTEIIDKRAESDSSLPRSFVPSCSSQKKRIIGLYSGGNQFHGDIYHPAGHCFMRTQYHDGSYDEFCQVCRYILVDCIEPSKHGTLNGKYSSRIYPT